MINELRELIAQNALTVLPLAGLTIGMAFGALMERTGFCAMGGVVDSVTLHDNRRLISWMLAAALTILGVLVLDTSTITDITKSRYLTSPLDWFGNIFGGVLFGIGMGLAGGCVSKNIVRAGTGDLRALIVTGVVGLFTFITLNGLLGPLRVAVADTTQIVPSSLGAQSSALDDLVTAATSAPNAATEVFIAILISASVITYAAMNPHFRNSPRHIAAGVGTALCAIAGWAITGLAYDEFALTPQPPTSISFVAPAAHTFEWMRQSTAAETVIPSFAVSVVLGTLLGSFATAYLGGRLRWVTFVDPPDTMRALSGAALMGFGGVVAGGCTIGQAVVGTSTLALGSFITFAAMIAGTVLCVRLLNRWA